MPLDIDFLRYFDWNPVWIDRIKTTVGKAFLPIQEKALRQAGLMEGRNILAVGPTSCGKGLLGELACLNRIRDARPGMFIVPTKALAAERYEQLRHRYGALGLQIVLSNRDHREHDDDICAGRYHIAVIVAEKLLALLSRSPQLFSPVGSVVVDELQMLFDDQRGSDLELLMTRLLREERLQVVGLSAVIEQAQRVADWLGATLIEEVERPIELRQGVLCGGVFHYREFNSRQQGLESLPEIQGDSEQELIFRAALHFASAGQMSLVFSMSKDESFAWADRFAKHLEGEITKEALEELDALEENLVTESLRRFLAKRVAVHNSDLTWPQRRLVERLAQRGDILILCSTSTLSEGVNLPVVNTFIPRMIFQHSFEDISRGRPPRQEPLSRSRFRNMTGRSARLGQSAMPRDDDGNPFGRGIMATPFTGDIEPLLRVYIEQPGGEEKPRLFSYGFEHSLLKLVATGSARKRREAVGFFEETLSFRTESTLADSPVPEKVDQTIEHLVSKGFLQPAGAGGELETTQLGLLAARSGVQPETLESFREFVSHNEAPLAEEVLLEVALSLDGRTIFLPLRDAEWKSRRYVNEFARRLEEKSELDRPGLNETLQGSDASSQPFAVALKKVLLMLDWITPTPTIEIERRYRLLTGHVEKIADGFSWLIEALAETGFVEGWVPESFGRTEKLARQIRSGLPQESVALESLYERGLNRSALLRLAEMGAETPDDVEQLPRKQLYETIGKAQADLLYRKEPPPRPSAEPLEAPPVDSVAETDTIIFGPGAKIRLSRAEPDRVYVQGKPVLLTQKQFELIWALAEEAGRCLSYDELMDKVWGDVAVEQQQISAHKTKVEKKIRKALGKDAPRLFRTIRGRGLVLDLPGAEVDIGK